MWLFRGSSSRFRRVHEGPHLIFLGGVQGPLWDRVVTLEVRESYGPKYHNGERMHSHVSHEHAGIHVQALNVTRGDAFTPPMYIYESICDHTCSHGS